MATVTLSSLSSATTVLATELNTLANNTVSGLSASGTGVALDNTGTKDPLASFELVVTFGTAPTAGTTLDLYAAASLDAGTSYADLPTTPAPPVILPIASFPLRAVTTAQRIQARDIPIGPYLYKFALYNNGTGQSTAATGNTVAARTYHPVVA